MQQFYVVNLRTPLKYTGYTYSSYDCEILHESLLPFCRFLLLFNRCFLCFPFAKTAWIYSEDNMKICQYIGYNITFSPLYFTLRIRSRDSLAARHLRGLVFLPCNQQRHWCYPWTVSQIRTTPETPCRPWRRHPRALALYRILAMQNK